MDSTHIETIIRECWGSHSQIVGDSDVRLIIGGAKLTAKGFERPAGGSPLDLSLSLEIIEKAVILIQLAFEIREIFMKMRGRLPTPIELSEESAKDERVKSLPEPVRSKLSRVCEFLAS